MYRIYRVIFDDGYGRILPHEHLDPSKTTKPPLSMLKHATFAQPDGSIIQGWQIVIETMIDLERLIACDRFCAVYVNLNNRTICIRPGLDLLVKPDSF